MRVMPICCARPSTVRPGTERWRAIGNMGEDESQLMKPDSRSDAGRPLRLFVIAVVVVLVLGALFLASGLTQVEDCVDGPAIGECTRYWLWFPPWR